VLFDKDDKADISHDSYNYFIVQFCSLNAVRCKIEEKRCNTIHKNISDDSIILELIAMGGDIFYVFLVAMIFYHLDECQAIYIKKKHLHNSIVTVLGYFCFFFVFLFLLGN
jgi:hypothetical protein